MLGANAASDAFIFINMGTLAIHVNRTLRAYVQTFLTIAAAFDHVNHFHHLLTPPFYHIPP